MKRNQLVADFSTSSGTMGSGSNCTMSVNVGAPINMLTTNKDSTLIAVAGRNVLKLYSVEQTLFREKVNLRSGRKHGLYLSCADIAWNHVNDNLIATAATNGAIVTWDLHSPSRNKQLQIFNDHKRTVTKVCFHNSEPGRLLSGSQDCTMKMFDLRRKECIGSFDSKSDGVRCVQFCPHEYFQFAASFDNGTVQIWDYRNTTSCLMQFLAHKGSVYTIDWHPDNKDKQRMATGGRDSKIKIWELIDHKMHEHMIIPTNAPVAMTRWRCQRREQIASVAMLLDHSISVWDMRRPYMPFALFTEHTDVTTGIAWKKNHPETLFSCSKDGHLYQHAITDAYRLSDHCNLSGLSLGGRGHIGYACTDNDSSSDILPHPKNKGMSRFGFRSVVGVAPKLDTSQWMQMSTASNSISGKFANFLSSKSELNIHNEKGDLAACEIFPSSLVAAAEQYKLQGKSFTEICAHNAAVAHSLQMPFDANIWNHIALFFKELVNKKNERSNSNSFHTSSTEKAALNKPSREAREAKNPNGIVTAESNEEESEQHSEPETEEHYLTDIARGHATSEQDCYYSEEEELGDPDFARGQHGGISSGFEGYADQDYYALGDTIGDTSLPTEAFHQRLVLKHFDSPDGQSDSVINGEGSEVLTAPGISIPSTTKQNQVLEKGRKKITKNASASFSAHSQSSSPQDHMSVSPVVYIKPYKNPFLSLETKAGLLASMYTEDCGRNIQVVVCSIIVLGHFIPSLQLPIDELLIEHWQTSYLDLISRYELWNHYTEIINLSTIPGIRSLNASSTIYIACGICKRRMPSSRAWICPKHAENDHKQNGVNAGIKCPFCQRVVKSLFTWCQGCSHGGHIDCMKEWFEWPLSKGRCPTGCGHVCTRTVNVTEDTQTLQACYHQ